MSQQEFEEFQQEVCHGVAGELTLQMATHPSSSVDGTKVHTADMCVINSKPDGHCSVV